MLIFSIISVFYFIFYTKALASLISSQSCTELNFKFKAKKYSDMLVSHSDVPSWYRRRIIAMD